MGVDDIPEIAQLTTPEKILLVEDLWDSVAADESSVPVPSEPHGGIGQKAEELRV